jgi:hypothetical protein
MAIKAYFVMHREDLVLDDADPLISRALIAVRHTKSALGCLPAPK